MINSDELNPRKAIRKLRGQWTAEVAQSLNLSDYDVLFDHGSASGRIISYFGSSNERGSQLSYLDIAIVRKNTNQAVALIEIEETANRPKTIIADIFAFLLGERVTYKGRDLDVGNETSFIVLAYSKVQQPKHKQYILDKIERVRSDLSTKNSKIGRIVIETYSSQDELSSFLMSLLSNL